MVYGRSVKLFERKYYRLLSVPYTREVNDVTPLSNLKCGIFFADGSSRKRLALQKNSLKTRKGVITSTY